MSASNHEEKELTSRPIQKTERSWGDPLTDEEREQFLTNWSETMPEVLTWKDDEIKVGLAVGM
jgi:uncharacterized protein YecA (UPF0149 family)